MASFASPARFQRLANRLSPWLWAAATLAIVVGLSWGLFFAPPDRYQHDSARIIYVHVPAAWMATFVYAVMALASAVGLVWRHGLAFIAAKAASPVGAAFTLLALVSGSLWGRPTWGAYWVWDGRLTSVLVLFFLYLGHIALLNAFDERARGQKAAAILAIVGAVNLPIIKFSVDWWNTLHQPASVFRLDGPTIAPELLWPLLISALGFTLYFFAILFLRMKNELLNAKLEALQMRKAEGR